MQLLVDSDQMENQWNPGKCSIKPWVMIYPAASDFMIIITDCCMSLVTLIMAVDVGRFQTFVDLCFPFISV